MKESDMGGETCGMCEIAKYRMIKYEIEPGITVDAGKCKKCGEIAFSHGVVKKIEAIRSMDSQQRSIVQVGSSLAVPFPAIFVKKVNLKAKGRVFVFEQGGNILIKTKLV